MRNLLTILLLTFPNLGMAIDLTISGPEAGKTGDLIVLSSVGSTADETRWIIPEALNGKTITCDSQVGFATRIPGTYVFHLYGAEVGDSGSVSIMHATHTVVVSGDAPTDPNPDPTDPPTGEFDDIEKFSRKNANTVDDPKYRTELYEALKSGNFGKDITAAQEQVRMRIFNVLKTRSRDEANTNWSGLWYVPLLQKLLEVQNAGRIQTLEDWEAAMMAAVKGLNP